MSLDTLIERTCKQTAVLWSYIGPDGIGGSEYGNPEEVKVRWSEEATVVEDNNGQEFVSRARILFTSPVSRKSRIMLGTLADITDAEEADPSQVESSFEIRRIDRRPRLGQNGFTIMEGWI